MHKTVDRNQKLRIIKINKQPKVAKQLGGETMTKNQLQELLTSARKKKSLTHEQVAELTRKGITRQYYGMIEKGERRPSVEVAKSIADVLELDWTIFFEVNSNRRLQKQAM